MTAVEDAHLDPERQERAKEYARLGRRLILADLVLTAVYTLAWLLCGWSGSLKQALLAVSANPWFLVAGYGVVFGAAYYVISLPLSFCEGFVLPHRFQLSTQSLPAWILDQVKVLGVGGILGGVMLEVIYAVLRAAPGWWWLWAGGILLFFNVLLANLAPILLFPLFYKFERLDDEHAVLAERLLVLARKADTRVRGVFKFDMSRRTRAANAALVGLGNTRRIILGDTLVDQFTADEIETVLAHELGHHVHKDIPLGIAFGSVLTLGGMYLASLGLRWGVAVFRFEGPADIAALPLFMLAIGIYGIVTLPLGNAFSRWRERLADAYALQSTNKGAAYASALARLANQNLAEADPEPWVEWLLYSHPALSRRIAMAKEYYLR